MGYVFRQDGINTMILEITSASTVVSEGLGNVQEAAEAIAGRDDWQGKKATAIKEYMTDAHGAILASTGLLMKDIYDQAMLYQKGYYDLDGDAHAVISENELEGLKSRLKQMSPVFETLDAEAQRIVNSIAHIGNIPYAGTQQLPDSIDILAEHLNLLDTDIGSLESDFSTRFHDELEMITSLKALISEARRTRLDTFSSDALAKSPNYQRVVCAYQNLAEKVQSNADKVKEAEACFQKTYEILEKEYQERIEKAQKAKFWTGVLTAVVSAVVITATGGAGVVVVGAVAGAINAGVGSYFDQQIGSVGYPGSVDWGKTVLDTAVGGALGAATSYVGAAFGAASSGMGTWGKIGMEGLKSVTTGAIERGGHTLADSISSGKSFTDVISDTTSSVFDVKQIAGDFAGGCAGGAFSQAFDSASKKLEGTLFSGENPGGAVSKNSPIMVKADSPYMHQGFTILSETAKETGKGASKRFAGTLTQTGSFSEAWDEATDKDKVVQDAAYAFAGKTASTATADVKILQEQHKLDEIQTKIEDGSRKFNNRNAAACEERGLPRNEEGTPDFSGRPECVGETTIRQSASSTTDYKNAFNQMVADGQIDPNEYTQSKSGHVIRTQTVMVDGKPTVVQTDYTVHHVHYDVNSGEGSFQLVETDAHSGIKHAGGDSQLQHAYKDHNAGEAISSYNDAVKDANQQLKDTNNALKWARQGGKSGAKVSATPDSAPDAPGSPSFNYQFDFVTP